MHPLPYLGPPFCSRLLFTAASPSSHIYSSQVHPSSCGRLWCCSCRVVCSVLFLLCVCVCDLFLFVQVHPPPYLGPPSFCSRLLFTAVSPPIHTYSSQVHPSSCGRLWCCSCRVVCLVLFLLCVCVCDLFLFTSPPPSLPGPTLLLFTPALYSCISSYSHLLFTSAPLFVWSFVVFLSCRVFGGVLVVCLRV